MANALKMGKNRNTRFGLNAFNKRASTAGNQHINAANRAKHRTNGLSVGCWHHLHRITRQASRRKPITHDGGKQAGGKLAITAAAQNGSIASNNT